MSLRIFTLAHQEARRRAAEAVRTAPDGFVVRIGPPANSRGQRERYHAMIGDIAKQWVFMGRKWPAEDVKRILVDAFAAAMREAGTPLHHDGRVIPSIDGMRVVQLGIQTREFTKWEASQFIEYLSAFGAQERIVWSDASRQPERQPEEA